MVRKWVNFLLDCLEKLEKDEPQHFSDPVIKDHIRSVGLELLIVKHFLRCTAAAYRCSENQNLKYLWEYVEDVVHAVAPVFHSQAQGRNIDLKLVAYSEFLEKIQLIKPQLRSYIEVSKSSGPHTRATHWLVVDNVDSILQDLKLLLQCKGDEIISVQFQVINIQKKLVFYRNLLDYVARCCTEHGKLKDLLVHIDAVANEARYVFYLCLLNEMDAITKMEVHALISGLLHKIDPSNHPKVEAIYGGVLKALKTSQVLGAATSSREVVASFEEFLLEKLKELLTCNADLILPIKDRIQKIAVELSFQRNFVTAAPEHEGFKNILDDNKAAANRLACLIYLLYASNTKKTIPWLIECGLCELLNEMRQNKTKIRWNYLLSTVKLTIEMDLDLLVCILRDLKLLRRCNADVISPAEVQIESLRKKLLFYRNLLDHLGRWCLGKLNDLLKHIDAAANEARFIFYMCLPSGMMDENRSRQVTTAMSDLLDKINPLRHPEVGKIYGSVCQDLRKSSALHSSSSREVVISCEELLLGMLKVTLNSNANVTVPVKHHIQILEMELSFQKRFMMAVPKEDLEHEIFKDILNDKKAAAKRLVCLIHLLYASNMKIEIIGMISALLKEMRHIKARIIWNYLNPPKPSRSNTCNDEILLMESVKLLRDTPIVLKAYNKADLLAPVELNFEMDFVYCILEDLKLLLKCKADIIAPVKNQIDTLREKLIFYRFHLKYAAKWETEHEKLKHLLIHLVEVVTEGRYVFYLCLLNEMDESMSRQVTNAISGLLDKINEVKLELQDNKNMKALATSGLAPRILANTEEFLLENFKELLIFNADLIAPAKDESQTLEQELRFQRNYLMDSSKQDNEPETFKVIFENIAAAANRQGFSIDLFCTKGTKKSIPNSTRHEVSGLQETVSCTSKNTIRNSLNPWEPSQCTTLNDERLLMGSVNFLRATPIRQLDSESCNAELLASLKHNIETVLNKTLHLVVFIRENIEQEKLNDLWTDIHNVANEVAGAIFSIYFNHLDEKLFKKLNLNRSAMLHLLNIIEWKLKCETNLFSDVKDQIKTIQEEIMFLISSLKDAEHCLKNDKFDCFLELLSTAINKVHPKLGFPELLEIVFLIKVEVLKYCFKSSKSSRGNICNNNELVGTLVDILIRNLKDLLNCGVDSVAFVQDNIQTVREELTSMRPFLTNVAAENADHEQLKNLATRIRDVVDETEYVIDLLVTGEGNVEDFGSWICDVIEEIKLIKEEIIKINNEKTCNNMGVLKKPKPLTVRVASQPKASDEVVVGHEDQASKLIDKLLSNKETGLGFVSIIGMAGLGKTTLAKKVYGDPLIREHFYVRAWCCVSQKYQKKTMLLDILGSVIEFTSKIYEMSDHKLTEKMYKKLKGKRFLIVFDDIWDIEAWRALERAFPIEYNGSKIMFTSRSNVVKLDRTPLSLRFLTKDESWDLLKMRVFGNEGCSSDLLKVGMEIAEKCRGLPLSIVVIAGLLVKTEKTPYWWKKIATSLSSQIIGDSKECMNTLELSYKHLPDHLKPCFLYWGAFPEDKEIPVKKLLRLWIAEGFVEKIERRILESVAEEYLNDLIDRSLIRVAKRRSNGGVKSCHIHDLLHKLSLIKAEEENFLQRLYWNNPCSTPSIYQQRRLFFYSERRYFVDSRPYGPHTRSLFFFCDGADPKPSSRYDISFIFHNFKLLRVLDLLSINMGALFPDKIKVLVHLRYLAVWVCIDHVPSSISNLCNLETLIVKARRGVKLLGDMSNMVKLRHLLINAHVCFDCSWSTQLSSLQTVSKLYFRETSFDETKGKSFYSMDWVTRIFPNIRKMGCIICEAHIPFPKFESLSKLVSLNVSYHNTKPYSCPFSFPKSLKKLTLSKFRLPWKMMSTIGRSLPNLEVLKLLFKSFEGPRWSTTEGDFRQVKFLKLDSLDVEEWDTYSEDFPSLQRLVIQRCKKLAEIPSCLGYVSTLHTVEVNWCSHSAAASARDIQEQHGRGNEGLTILVYPSLVEIKASEHIDEC